MDGSGVLVAAPTITPDRELQAIVRERAPWILSHLSDAVLRAAPNRFVSGETLPYLGRNVRLVIEPADVRSTEIRFDHWRFRVAVPMTLEAGQRYEQIRRAVVEVIQVPGRRAAAGRCLALVAQTGTGRKVTDTGPRPAPTLGKLRP